MREFLRNFMPLQDDTREIDIKFLVECKMQLFVCDWFVNIIRQEGDPLTEFKDDDVF